MGSVESRRLGECGGTRASLSVTAVSPGALSSPAPGYPAPPRAGEAEDTCSVLTPYLPVSKIANHFPVILQSWPVEGFILVSGTHRGNVLDEF